MKKNMQTLPEMSSTAHELPPLRNEDRQQAKRKRNLKIAFCNVCFTILSPKIIVTEQCVVISLQG
jgi:hypothetical protein